MSSTPSIPADLLVPDGGPEGAGGPGHPTDRWAPPEKPSYRGEIVFLSVVLVLTIVLAVAGVPGEPEPVAGNGSDRLRQGWLEEQLLTQHAARAAAPEVLVRDRSPTEDELLRELSGTWLVESLKAAETETPQNR